MKTYRILQFSRHWTHSNQQPVLHPSVLFRKAYQSKCVPHWQQKRPIQTGPQKRSQAAAVAPAQDPDPQQPGSSNPALAFPCLDAQEAKTASLAAGRAAPAYRSHSSGPEPSYTTGSHHVFHASDPILLDWGGVLPSFDIAFETWGTLNSVKSNAILLHTGLSASSHAHSTPENSKLGWWENFIGPDAPLDTSKYFIICTNVIGSCYGSTGPSSVDPADGSHYATRFPILTMEDMVRAQFRLLDGLGIDRLYASVGASMGGMQSLAAGILFPSRVNKIVSISGCARSHPYSIAMRHTQRQVLMMDPKWNRGFYYDHIPPHDGMKLAREIATVTYRSGPEWEKRFGRQRADPSKQPALCPDFLIETYLDHAGEKFSLDYDANSLLYVSKAMDLFDLGRENQLATSRRRQANQSKLSSSSTSSMSTSETESCNLTLPSTPYTEQQSSQSSTQHSPENQSPSSPSLPSSPPKDLIAGLSPLSQHPILVMGVASDILFPAWQQREVAETLRAGGSRDVTHIELGEEVSMFGHDTFLLDREHVGGGVGRFLG